MGYKKLIYIILINFFCYSCNGNPTDKDINTQIELMGLSQFFKNGDKPLNIYDVESHGKVAIDLPNIQPTSYGILIVNGYELGKKYGSKKPVITLKNINFNSESFATSHSAFRSFSAKDGSINLELINNVDEKITVIFYILKEQ